MVLCRIRATAAAVATAAYNNTASIDLTKLNLFIITYYYNAVPNAYLKVSTVCAQLRKQIKIQLIKYIRRLVTF